MEDLTPGRVGQVPIELDGDLATDQEAVQSQLIEQLGRVHDFGVTIAGGLRRAGTLAVLDPNSRWLTVADRADEPGSAPDTSRERPCAEPFEVW